ncbi:MAG: DUF2330 domain-containing protein [Polyangia bacterium]
MRCILALATSAATLLTASLAFPCGGAFGPNVAVDPQQDIIVVWKDGVETYVFQPIFCGTATDFGLILPVSAPLTQNPSLTDQQAYTTAAALAAPTKVQVQEGGGIGCLGGAASAGARATDETTSVVASGQVGFLDWVQLKADTPSSFTDWLTANGYPYSASAADVFAYYVQDGYYFLAFRISQEAVPDGGTVCKALGPVSFAFPAQVAVVPTRMATAGSTMTTSSSNQFSWRIFGITHGTEQLGEQGMSGYTLGYSGAIEAADVAGLAGLAEAGDRLTRLMVTFSYTSTDSDLKLGTSTPSDYRDQEYVTVNDDSACSVNRAVPSPHRLPLLMLGLVLAGLVCWRRWR